MRFAKWIELRMLKEVGPGGGGVGSGLVPPLQRPDITALQDYHGEENKNPKNQNGKLPPVKKRCKKMRWTLTLIIFLISFSAHAEDSLLRYKVSLSVANKESEHINTIVPAYISSGKDADLDSLQCPIPKKDRVRNYTGIQCVWSSIETLGRWAGEERLIAPALTSRKECKSYSGPELSSRVLGSLGVRFKQTFGDRKKGIEMIKEAMAEGRGALFDVPGHAMVIVHFSEEENRVCWIDNSDDTVKVQTSTMARFMERWRTWVLVIYAEEDMVPYRIYARKIPVFGPEGDNLLLPINFVPFPAYIK